MTYLPTMLFVTVLYLLITADFSVLNFMISFLIGLGVSLVFRPKRRIIRLASLPTTAWALLRYIWILILDLIKSGIQVAWILIQTKLPINPGIITISADCESELANALSAHAISLTPGEIVVEMDEHGYMYTHVLDITHADEYLEEAQEIRRGLLRKIFP